jgi:hypothetical protein
VDPGTRSPYKVEIVGVTCDPGLAVARGIWRQACCCGARRALHGFTRSCAPACIWFRRCNCLNAAGV